MIKRRPVRVFDIAQALGMPREEIEGTVKGLVIKGLIHEREHAGELFLVMKEVEKV